MKKVDERYYFPEKFQYAVQNTENGNTFDTGEKGKTLYSKLNWQCCD